MSRAVDRLLSGFVPGISFFGELIRLFVSRREGGFLSQVVFRGSGPFECAASIDVTCPVGV